MSLIGFLVVPGLVLAVLERWRRTRREAQPFWRARFADDVGFLLVGWIATAAFSLDYVARASTALHGAPAPRAATFGLVAIAIVLLDLGNYLCHLLLHRVDALWEFHKVHHSSPSLDWLATFRSHLVEQLLRRLLAPVLLIAVGFPLGVVATAGGIFTAWAMLNHANLNLRLRALERLFITPRLHRLHHLAASGERNLGTVLSVWDRLRGSFVDDGDGPMGVPGERYPQAFFALLREPFRRLWRSAATLALVGVVALGCAAPARRARPPRTPCTWELSFDIPIPAGRY